MDMNTPPSHAATKPGIILLITALSSFMAMLDAMVIATASTSIRTDLGLSVSALQWSMNAYNLILSAFLIVAAAIGDRFGHKRFFITGIVIFILGSIGCALSHDVVTLIGSRIVQGIGASFMTTLSLAILTAVFEPAQRGKALGMFAGLTGLALIAGPVLGGTITACLSWPWIFWLNVPFGGIVALLASHFLPSTKGNGRPINIIDAILVMLATSGLVWALTNIARPETLQSALIIGIIALLITALFIYRQKNGTSPMVPLDYFKSNTFSVGILACVLLYSSMYGVVFFLPQFLIQQNFNAMQAGLGLLPWTGTLFLVAPSAGRIVDKIGERPVAATGLLLQAIGYFWISFAVTSPTYHYATIVIPLIISGAGISMAAPALQKAILSTAKKETVGQISGIFSMFRLLGGATGIAIAVFIFYSTSQKGSGIIDSLSGYSSAILGSAIISLLGTLCALMLKNDAHTTTA